MGETLSEAIGADHHLFDVYYENLINSPDDGAKVRWRNQLTWLVARHAISEELTWYPAMEKHMGEEGRKLAMTDKEQHNGVEAVLLKLQDTSPTSSGFQELLDELMGNLHHHAEHEKNEDMPRFEALLSREESEAYARQFQRTKAIVPTRSHSGLPKSYIFEDVAALLAAPLDRFADLMRDFPDEQDQSEAQKAADDNKSAGRESVGGRADLLR